MARCSSCSAPLPANSNRCRYCGTRNDVDLSGQNYQVAQEFSNRICPHCDIPLQTILLKKANPLFIEHCTQCFGLFFDPGELEVLLEQSVSGAIHINLKHLVNINRDRYQGAKKVRYIKCPQCRNFMKRANFGYRSGVVINKCPIHGVWLDNGDLIHLLEWKKAGGQLLHKQHAKKTQAQKKHALPLSDNFSTGKAGTDDLVDSIANVIFNLFD